MKTKSDTWDRGNRLTQFYEVNEICPLCDGCGDKKISYIE